MDDFGAQAVQTARAFVETLGLGTADISGGFRWRVASLDQEIWAERLGGRPGDPAYRVRVVTQLLQGVDPELATRVLPIEAADTLISCPVFQNGSVSYHSSLVVDRAYRDWVCGMLPHVARLQLACAEADVEGLASNIGGRRPVPQEVPRAARFRRVQPPAGVRPFPFGSGRWEQRHLARAIQSWRVYVSVPAPTVEDSSLRVEFPWKSDQLADAGERAVLEFRIDTAHPTAGTGLLALLSLPIQLSEVEVLELNAAEARGDFAGDSLGAWCISPVDGVATFVSFLPDLLTSPLTLLAAARSAEIRVRWAAERMS